MSTDLLHSSTVQLLNTTDRISVMQYHNKDS